MADILEFNNCKYKEVVYTNLKNTISRADVLIYDEDFIVALQYVIYLDYRPRLILKSVYKREIINIAKNLNIPVMKRKITRELATTLKVNDYINPSMFAAIANILVKAEKEKKIKSKNWEYYFNKGLLNLSEDDFNNAIVNFKKSLKLNKNYKTYSCKACAENELGNFTVAIKDYGEAIKLCPEDYLLYYKRGIINGKLDKFKEKIDDCTRAIEIYLRNSDVYYSRGLAYTDIGNNNKAIKDFEKVLKLDSEYSLAYYQIAYAKEKLEDYLGAIKYYTKYIELESKDSDGYFARAWIKNKINDYNGAINDYSKAIKLKPTSNAYYNRGLSNLSLKNCKKAIYDFSKAIKLNPNKMESYAERGFTKYIINNYKGAISDFKKAISIDRSEFIYFYKSYFAIVDENIIKDLLYKNSLNLIKR